MALITHLQLHRRARTIASERDSFLDDCRDLRGLSLNTLDAYRYDLAMAATALPAPLDLITTTDVEAFLVARREKPGTTNRRISSLRRFFRWAMKQGYCDHNPVDLVEAKHDDTHLPRPIRTADELKALDAAIAAAPQPYRLIFTILRETGMRADEVLGLDVGDVTLDPGREGLRVREAKNNTDRTVVLTADVMPRTLRGLRARLRELGKNPPPSVPLFRSNRGTRVAYDTLHYHWGKVCSAAGLVDLINGKPQPRYTIHQLRHTVGTTLIARYPEQVVSRILGHRDPRSTRRYADVNDDQVRAALSGNRRR